MAGFVIGNIRAGAIKQFHWDDLPSLPHDGSVTFLDTRTTGEFADGHFDDAVNIPWIPYVSTSASWTPSSPST